MPNTISPESVIDFLHHFESLGEQEDFALIRDHMTEDAYFRCNDGDFVGRTAIQAVFEKAWRGGPTVKSARFSLTNIVVLTTDTRTAPATHTSNCEGSHGDEAFTIIGRGTRVVEFEDGRFRIAHEHLSRFAAA